MEGKKLLLKGHLINPHLASSGRGIIAVEDGIISYTGEDYSMFAGADYQFFDFGPCYICPGFIDMHIHGYAGADVMDCSPEGLETMSWELAQKGTTSFLATTMSAPSAELIRVIKNISATKRKGTRGAQIVGGHLEGPFLNLGKKGAHKAEYLRLPNIPELRDYIDAGGGCVRMITIAPELTGALEVIKLAREKGLVVSLGHSDASIAQVEEANRSGLQHVTHAFNAMAGLHHRDPGTIGAILSMKQFSVDVITDGHHVHPYVIKILVHSKGLDQVSAISDCMRAGGQSDGKYELGGQKIVVKNGRACLEDGTLAGSTITLADGVKLMVEKVGLSLEEAVRMVSVNPARTLGLSDRGILEQGKRADIVVLDHHLQVLMTIVEGRVVKHNSYTK